MPQQSLPFADTQISALREAFDGDDPWWAISASGPRKSRRDKTDDQPSEDRKPRSSPAPTNGVGPAAGCGGEWIPRAPATLEDSGLSESQIESLILKFLLNWGSASGREISEQVKLPLEPVQNLLRRMKADQLVVYKSSNAMNDHEHQLTNAGCEQARRYSQQCTYFGTAPVSLADYNASVAPQSPRRENPSTEKLLGALSDLVISRDIIAQLGQAICAGAAIFLYGPPGNGKTSMAERLIQAFGKTIWIPRAISVWGEIIRLFDPSVHEPAPIDESGLPWKYDRRWVRIKRPTIVAGGELTRSQLDMTVHGSTGIVESPLHLKSNGGALVIDDFGRQQISTAELLNRWIVPLEKSFDYLTLPSGKKIQVPFDQLIIFATNLEPRELVDEAFLRRIPYKIEVGDPSEDEFRALFRLMAPRLGVEYREGPVNYLIAKHYRETGREFRYCHPRDLLLQVKTFCVYHDHQPTMSNESFDAAVRNYFAVM